MAEIKISDLEETTSVDDELCMVPVDDGSSTKKISLKNLEASGTASAAAYAEAAAASAETAEGHATNAGTSESNARTYASNASDSATTAAGSASDASGYADTASAAASNASGSASSAAGSANSAAQQVANAAAKATLAESWAVGGTGTRAGENTNNAQYWSTVAQAAAGGGVVTFNGRTGAVVPASGDYNAGQISRGTSTVDADLTSAENDITAIKGDIAPSEDGETASQGYAIGKQFLRNGSLYKAKTAITAGDALVLGTNYEAADDITLQLYNQNETLKTLQTNKEDKGIIKTATLAIGATTVTFTDIPTTGNNLIKFYNSLGINYEEIDTSTSGQITLTFEEQEVVVTVFCEIKGVTV